MPPRIPGSGPWQRGFPIPEHRGVVVTVMGVMLEMVVVVMVTARTQCTGTQRFSLLVICPHREKKRRH